MPAITPARPLQLLIGSDSQDWSNQVESLIVGYNAIEDEGSPGQIAISGVIEIQPSASAPESADPLANPTRWKKGQDLIVRPRNDANTGWLDCPWSRLKILTVPARLRTNANLRLEVGCKLSFAEAKQLQGERTGVIFGQSTACNVVASRLLEAAGIDSTNINLSAWPYQLAVPVGNDQVNYADQASALAYANDWRILYQNSDGRITQQELDFTVSGAIATVTRSLDDILYEPTVRDFEIPELTKVAGVGYDISDVTSPIVNIDDVVVDDFSALLPGSFGSGIAERTVTTISWTIDPAPVYSVREQFYQAEGLAFLNPSIPTQLVLISDETSTQYYESGKQDPTKARLIQQIQNTLESGKKRIPSDEIFNYREIYRKQIDITYSATESMSRYRAVERQTESVLDELTENPWNQRVTLSEDFQWTEYAPGRWDRFDQVKLPIIADRSRFRRDIQDPWATISRPKRYSRERDNRPFTTKTFEFPFTESERHYAGTAVYIPDGGPSGQELEQLFTVETGFAFSDTQMSTLAGKHLRLLQGLARKYDIRLALNDALLQSPPLPEIDVIADGNTFTYFGDVLTFEFQQTQAIAECQGIWVDGGYTYTANASRAVSGVDFAFDIYSSDANASRTVSSVEFNLVLTALANASRAVPGATFAATASESGGSSSAAWQTATLSEWQTLTLSEWQTLPLS